MLGFNRKRAHSPDAEGRDSSGGQAGWNSRSPFQRNFNSKRQRSESIPDTIDVKITRVGESQNRNQTLYITRLAIDIANVLSNKDHEDDNIKLITTKICQCIVSFPSRIPTYSTLISLISTKHYNVSSQIVETLHSSYTQYFEAQRWQEALTIFQTLAYLVNCRVIQPHALLTQFEHFIDLSQEEGIPQKRSDYLIYSILSSLPFAGLVLSDQTEQPNNFDKILSSLEVYLDKRDKSHVEKLRVWQTSDATSQMDYLDSLWIQIKNFRSNGWNESLIYRPYNEKEVNDQLTCNLIHHNMTNLQVPPHSDNYQYPLPKIVLRIFEDDAADINTTIPGADKIERFFLENHIRNIIDELSSNSMDCGRLLGYMSHEAIFSIKHVLIETILAELFTIPKPKHDEIVYQSILFDVSKTFLPNTNRDQVKFNFGSIMHQAVLTIYENIETMNVACLDRFINCFSLYLNDTNFIYPWQTWSDVIQKEPHNLKTVFVKMILEHCVRFSFHKKVETMVKDHLSTLMPPEPKVTFSPTSMSENDIETIAETYKRMITTKQELPDVCKTLNIKIDGVNLSDDFELQDEKPSEKLLKIDVFFAILLNLGSRSVAHLSSGIGKYKSAILALISDTPDGQMQLLKTASSCLDSHPQLMVILFEKLHKAEFVDASLICDWIFSHLKAETRHKHHVYDILLNTMNRLSTEISKLHREKKEFKPSEGVGKDASGSADVLNNPTGDDVEMKPEPTEGESQPSNLNNKPDIDSKIREKETKFVQLSLEIFRKFTELLTDHIQNCQASGVPHQDSSFSLKLGKMQQFYFQFIELLYPAYNKISNIISSCPPIASSIPDL